MRRTTLGRQVFVLLLTIALITTNHGVASEMAANQTQNPNTSPVVSKFVEPTKAEEDGTGISRKKLATTTESIINFAESSRIVEVNAQESMKLESVESTTKLMTPTLNVETAATVTRQGDVLKYSQSVQIASAIDSVLTKTSNLDESSRIVEVIPKESMKDESVESTTKLMTSTLNIGTAETVTRQGDVLQYSEPVQMASAIDSVLTKTSNLAESSRIVEVIPKESMKDESVESTTKLITSTLNIETAATVTQQVGVLQYSEPVQRESTMDNVATKTSNSPMATPVPTLPPPDPEVAMAGVNTSHKITSSRLITTDVGEEYSTTVLGRQTTPTTVLQPSSTTKSIFENDGVENLATTPESTRSSSMFDGVERHIISVEMSKKTSDVPATTVVEKINIEVTTKASEIEVSRASSHSMVSSVVKYIPEPEVVVSSSMSSGHKLSSTNIKNSTTSEELNPQSLQLPDKEMVVKTATRASLQSDIMTMVTIVPSGTITTKPLEGTPISSSAMVGESERPHMPDESTMVEQPMLVSQSVYGNTSKSTSYLQESIIPGTHMTGESIGFVQPTMISSVISMVEQPATVGNKSVYGGTSTFTRSSSESTISGFYITGEPIPTKISLATSMVEQPVVIANKSVYDTSAFTSSSQESTIMSNTSSGITATKAPIVLVHSSNINSSSSIVEQPVAEEQSVHINTSSYNINSQGSRELGVNMTTTPEIFVQATKINMSSSMVQQTMIDEDQLFHMNRSYTSRLQESSMSSYGTNKTEAPVVLVQTTQIISPSMVEKTMMANESVYVTNRSYSDPSLQERTMTSNTSYGTNKTKVPEILVQPTKAVSSSMFDGTVVGNQSIMYVNTSSYNPLPESTMMRNASYGSNKSEVPVVLDQATKIVSSSVVLGNISSYVIQGTSISNTSSAANKTERVIVPVKPTEIISSSLIKVQPSATANQSSLYEIEPSSISNDTSSIANSTEAPVIVPAAEIISSSMTLGEPSVVVNQSMYANISSYVTPGSSFASNASYIAANSTEAPVDLVPATEMISSSMTLGEPSVVVNQSMYANISSYVTPGSSFASNTSYIAANSTEAPVVLVPATEIISSSMTLGEPSVVVNQSIYANISSYVTPGSSFASNTSYIAANSTEAPVVLVPATEMISSSMTLGEPSVVVNQSMYANISSYVTPGSSFASNTSYIAANSTEAPVVLVPATEIISSSKTVGEPSVVVNQSMYANISSYVTPGSSFASNTSYIAANSTEAPVVLVPATEIISSSMVGPSMDANQSMFGNMSSYISTATPLETDSINTTLLTVNRTVTPEILVKHSKLVSSSITKYPVFSNQSTSVINISSYISSSFALNTSFGINNTEGPPVLIPPTTATSTLRVIQSLVAMNHSISHNTSSLRRQTPTSNMSFSANITQTQLVVVRPTKESPSVSEYPMNSTSYLIQTMNYTSTKVAISPSKTAQIALNTSHIEPSLIQRNSSVAEGGVTKKMNTSIYQPTTHTPLPNHTSFVLSNETGFTRRLQANISTSTKMVYSNTSSIYRMEVNTTTTAFLPTISMVQNKTDIVLLPSSISHFIISSQLPMKMLNSSTVLSNTTVVKFPIMVPSVTTSVYISSISMATSIVSTTLLPKHTSSLDTKTISPSSLFESSETVMITSHLSDVFATSSSLKVIPEKMRSSTVDSSVRQNTSYLRSILESTTTTIVYLASEQLEPTISPSRTSQISSTTVEILRVNKQEFRLVFRIVSETFTEELLDQRSKEFRKKSREVEETLNNVYKEMPEYDFSEVLAFSAGSLVCDVAIFTESESELSAEQVKEPLIEAKESESFGEYEVADITVREVTEDVKTKKRDDEQGEKHKTWSLWPVVVIAILGGLCFLLLVVVITQCIQKRHYSHSLAESSSLAVHSPEIQYKGTRESATLEERIPMSTFNHSDV